MEKMICVNSAFRQTCQDHGKPKNSPKLNEIVTVVGVTKWFGCNWLSLKEYPKLPCGCDLAYDSGCFRPIDEYLEQFSIQEILESELVEV